MSPKPDQAAPNPHGLFTIEGECLRPRAFSLLDLSEIHSYYQVADISRVDERLPPGKAVRLRKLIDLAGPAYGVTYLTLHTLDGGFTACAHLPGMSRQGLVVYQLNGKPLSYQDGGPVRLVVPFAQDQIAHVRSIARFVLTREPTGPVRAIQRSTPVGAPGGSAL